jgi:hypothetical protein
MGIDQALSDIQESAFLGKPFSIRFITMDGEERFYVKARYGAPDSWRRNAEKLVINERLGTAQRSKRKVSLMRDDGTIPITRIENGIGIDFRTPKWFGIIELNGERVF